MFNPPRKRMLSKPNWDGFARWRKGVSSRSRSGCITNGRTVITWKWPANLSHATFRRRPSHHPCLSFVPSVNLHRSVHLSVWLPSHCQRECVLLHIPCPHRTALSSTGRRRWPRQRSRQMTSQMAGIPGMTWSRSWSGQRHFNAWKQIKPTVPHMHPFKFETNVIAMDGWLKSHIFWLCFPN